MPITKSMGNSGDDTHNLLVFHLSGLDCAVPLEAVREVVPMATLSTPPGIPSGLLGFLDLRGTAIPIVRLDRLCDLPVQAPGLHTPLIVLRGGLSPLGILVDSVRGVVQVASERFLPVPEEHTFHGCTTAVLQLDGAPIYLLSPAALLAADENRLVTEYSAMSQSRRLHLEEAG